MSGNVTGERRGHEAGPLVGPPVLGQDPIHTGNVSRSVHRYIQPVVSLESVDVVRTLPCEDLDLADVFPQISCQRVGIIHQFDVAGVKRNAVGTVTREGGIRGLSLVGHVADGGHGTGVVVVALDTPCSNGGIVYRSAKRQIRLDFVFQRVDFIAFAHPIVCEIRMGHDFIEDAEPVPGRCFAVGAICPEFGQDPSIVSERDQLLLIRQAGMRIQIVSRSGIASCEVVVEITIIQQVIGEFGRVADRGRTCINHDAIERVVM